VKKKVLIITYYWPPSGGGGVQRWLKFAKYLRDYNWEPVIYTVENGEYPEFDHTLEKDVPENLTIIKTKIWEPYLLYKKFIGQKSTDKINTGFLTEKKKPGLAERISVWLRGNLFIPDARKFWITPSIKYLLRYIPQNKINVVITTGPPHSLHLIGLKLKLQLNIKWLADFRDPWTNIDYYQDLKLTSYADKKHHNMEASVINNADVITVVGKTMKDEFEAAYKKKIEVITNGYDEHDIPDGNISLDKKFSIAHIGSMTKTRNPESLWQALRELVVEEKDFANHLQIELIGKADISVTESLTRNDLLKYFLKKDYLPHTQVTTAQQQAQVLLLVVNRTKNQKGILTGKLFEYILAKRPILCMGPVDGDAAEIIKDTNAGSVVEVFKK
jgi:glycosyltransferase involved in cell wall biosynthesis